MSASTGGSNPHHGRDQGSAPPQAPTAGTANGNPLPPDTRIMGTYAYVPAIPPTYHFYNPYYAAPPPYTSVAPATAPTLGTAIAADPFTGIPYQYVSGLAGSERYPTSAPPVDPDFPAANHINTTGGAGLEPGFNYFFPNEHANVIVLKCATAPWKLARGSYADIPFHAAKVPANVTMAELLAGFGACNPDKAKNQFWEVYPQGGGAWGWKEHVRGDDEVIMMRTVKAMGWTQKRGGKQQTVFLWITKN
ncbi:hypothetical protein VTJ83DRAFT_3649 [Remersonia thermophila]|uniref:Uncharacterized protein n=1 Tax=Remersonia thermophila TaxID=72144 RepID=A0ABR4DEL1_9PEZI